MQPAGFAREWPLGMPLHTPEYAQFLGLLKQLRLEKTVTQSELSRRLGKPQQYVSRCEVGERRLDAIELLAWCEALDADVGALFADLQSVLRSQKSLPVPPG